MKIGVTSQNFKTITGHAGKTRRFIIFSEISSGQWAETGRLDLPKEMVMHAFRGETHPVDEVDVLITGSCGEGFKRRMSARGIDVMTTSESDPVDAVNKVSRGIALGPAEPHHH